MVRILAICLGHKEKLNDNYETLKDLRDVLVEKYKKYLQKKGFKKTRVNIILTYMEKPENGVDELKEKLLEDITVIKNHGNEWFQLFVKRVSKFRGNPKTEKDHTIKNSS